MTGNPISKCCSVRIHDILVGDLALPGMTTGKNDTKYSVPQPPFYGSSSGTVTAPSFHAFGVPCLF